MVFSVLALILAGAAAWAQPSGAVAGRPGMKGALAKLFGNNTSFSTTAKMTMTGAAQPMIQEMNLAMLDGSMRMEVDLTKGTHMPTQSLEQMKRIGMDKLVTVDRPDKKISLTIFPSMQAYSETPLDDGHSGPGGSDLKIEKTKVGDETIDGHPCVKNKVVMTEGNGQKREALMWNAVDMREFPLQMEMQEEGNTVKLKFSNIKLDKPDRKLFEAPTGFTKYKDQNELMRTEMMKRASQTPTQKQP